MAGKWRLRKVKGPTRDQLTRKEVCEHLDIGEEALKGLIERGEFPRPFTLSPGEQRWHWWVVPWFFWHRQLLPYLPTPPEVGADRGGSEGFRAEPRVSGGKRGSGRVDG